MKKFNMPRITAKDAVLSFQHMFAMLGATILVPILSGMSIPLALLSAGLGTIAFYFITQRKVPVFLGSSFAFLPALSTVIGTSVEQYSAEWNARSLAAMLALFCAGLVYIILAVVIYFVGVEKVKKLFPPIVVGPVVIVIGMILVPKTFWNNIILNYSSVTPIASSVAWKQWTTAGITALTIILVNAFAKPKSFLKVIPILLGFVVGYIYSLCIGLVNFEGVFSADNIIIFQNMDKYFGFYGAWGDLTGAMVGSAMLSIVPLALVTFMEHLGDISANSTVCGKDFMVDPGLHRTVLGDGVATSLSALLGGPANTTYGENTAVLSITKNYNPRNIFFAACLAVLFGIFCVFGDLLSTIPSPVIGGASIVLFGMISASGLRALVDAKVDFGNSKNMIVVSVVLSLGLGLGAMSLAGDILANAGVANASQLKIMIGSVEISPLAIATLAGILLNLIIPDHDKSEKENPVPQYNDYVTDEHALAESPAPDADTQVTEETESAPEQQTTGETNHE